MNENFTLSRQDRLTPLAALREAIFEGDNYEKRLDFTDAGAVVGGQGFTGLNYSYTPGSPAELQYWCEASL